MPRYSGVPLPKKLGIRPGFRVYLVNEPSGVHAKLRSALAGCDVVRGAQGGLDFMMVFAKTRKELTKEFSRGKESLTPAGILWASWPKKSSGVLTDLNEHAVRALGLKRGLVDVKVCSVSETWSGLKFVRRVTERGGDS